MYKYPSENIHAPLDMWLVTSQGEKNFSDTVKSRTLKWDFSLSYPWFATVLCIVKKRAQLGNQCHFDYGDKVKRCSTNKRMLQLLDWLLIQTLSILLPSGNWFLAACKTTGTLDTFLFISDILSHKVCNKVFFVVFWVGLFVCTCVYMCFSNHKIFICTCKRKLRLTAILVLYLIHF